MCSRSAQAIQKVVGNSRVTTLTLPPRRHSPHSKMPSEETKVRVLAPISFHNSLCMYSRRESSRLSTWHAYVYVGHLPGYCWTLTVCWCVDCRPLRLGSLHHLCRIHEKQPSAVPDQVSVRSWFHLMDADLFMPFRLISPLA